MLKINDDILQELESISPLIAKVPRINVFQVPEHYFENLSSHILLKINVLSTSKSVPEGYFESLPDILINRIRSEANVVSIKKQYSFLKYAIAAVVVGIIGLNLFSFFNQQKDERAILLAEANQIIKTQSFDAVFESIPEDEIENYLIASGSDVNAALVANVAYNKELPAEIDYLSEAHTLDTFLEELNIETKTTK